MAALCVGALAVSSATFADEVQVQTQVVEGSRTYALRTLTGGDLQSISLGRSADAGFMTTVSDVAYSRTGYQLNAVLSDLYHYDDGSYTCGERIDSDKLALGFVVDPVSVTDVAQLAAPIWHLQGTLDATLASLLGVPTGTVIEVDGLVGEELEGALDGVLDGVEDTLPIKVAAGAGGAFTDAGPHESCNPSPGTAPTTRTLQGGEPGNLTALLDWLTAELEDVVDGNADDVISTDELLDAGAVTEEALAEAVRAALADAGVDLGLLDTLLAQGTLSMEDIYAVLEATLSDIESLVGQTGLYASLPKLTIDIPGEVGAGTYRGTMTVTLVDVE